MHDSSDELTPAPQLGKRDGVTAKLRFRGCSGQSRHAKLFVLRRCRGTMSSSGCTERHYGEGKPGLCRDRAALRTGSRCGGSDEKLHCPLPTCNFRCRRATPKSKIPDQSDA